jgi:hypothetical protein
MDSAFSHPSRLFFGILVVLVFGIGLGLGWTISGEKSPTMLTNTSTQATSSEAMSETDIVKEYLASSFRVVAIVPNPFGKDASSSILYIVTERGTNDEGCGGMYTAGKCYFFLESNYYGVPPIQFIGTWGYSDSTSFLGGVYSKMHFRDANTFIFETAFGDAGAAVYETWALDIRTASTTLLSSKETDIYDTTR